MKGISQRLREQSRGDLELEAADFIDDLVDLLSRYRAETPLGNQPHMIAEKADRLLAKVRGTNRETENQSEN